MTWTIDGSLAMGNLDVIGNGTRICMIDCDDDTVSDHEIVAAAQLIAAAPDLLAALIELDAWAMHESNSIYPMGTFEVVREAITKAIGDA